MMPFYVSHIFVIYERTTLCCIRYSKEGEEWARARMKWDFYAVNIVQSRIAELSSLCYISITHKNAVKSFLLFCFVFPSAAAVGAFSRDVRHSVLASSHTLRRGSPNFGVVKAITKAERAREYRQPKKIKRTLEIWLESRDLSLFSAFSFNCSRWKNEKWAVRDWSGERKGKISNKSRFCCGRRSTSENRARQCAESSSHCTRKKEDSRVMRRRTWREKRCWENFELVSCLTDWK